MSYFQIYVWKRLVEKASCFELESLRKVAPGENFQSPMESITLQDNQHVSKYTYIGKAIEDGKFEIVWQSQEPIEALPWLGMEKVNFPLRYFLRNILSEYPKMIDSEVELENRVRERTMDLEKTMKQLSRTEERLRYTLEATNDGLWDWNLEENTVYWSPNNYTMLGYEIDEFPVSYEIWRILIHPKDLARCEPKVQKALETGESFQVEFRFRKKDGSWKWILGRGQCVQRDKSGNPIRMVGTHLDLTVRKMAERALKESEKRHRTLFENHHTVMLLIEPRTGNILDANPAAEKFYGWPREVMKQKNISDFYVYSVDLEKQKIGTAEKKRSRLFLFFASSSKWTSTLCRSPFYSYRSDGRKLFIFFCI